MRVKIGPYKNFFGPYQIAEKILFWKDKYEDDMVHKFGRWLSGDYVKEPDQWVGKNVKPSLLLRFCQWVDSKRKRTIKIHLDNYDTWNMGNTLSLIVVPLLKQLKATQHGAPWTDDEDVPEHLRSTAAPAKENEWDIDENHFKRYDWVLKEMIWTFETLSDGDHEGKFFDHSDVKEKESFTDQISKIKVDHEGLDAHNERIKNGLRLFGKYYRTLWD